LTAHRARLVGRPAPPRHTGPLRPTLAETRPRFKDWLKSLPAAASWRGGLRQDRQTQFRSGPHPVGNHRGPDGTGRGSAGPADGKALEPAQLPQLAQDIRAELVEVTAKNGGHIGPNLGVVELTIALHRVFHTPDDQLVFDVAHQGYVHKLLTGRQGEFFR